MQFAELDRKARAGDGLSVVFFGASLTWGANSTDPQLTSYRAGVAERLQGAYPQAHWAFWDAAIGGTTSQLGIFRLERDVLRRNPDLVFLDFSLNDGMDSADEERLSSYEAIVRRLVQAGVAVVQVLLPSKSMAELESLDSLIRRSAHLRISEAYQTGVGDAVALIQNRVRTGAANSDALWSDPGDTTHPTDAGYALYAEAAWQGLQSAIERRLNCETPVSMLHRERYMRTARVRLAPLSALPPAWQTGRPNRISAYYDMLMSRWLDDEVIASRPESSAPMPAPLLLRFAGEMALLFGESTPASGHYRVRIDGGAWSERYDAGGIARPSHGNAHHVQVLAEGLDSSRSHTLELQPDLQPGEELRFESLCVAGGSSPSVTLPTP